ncbi:hypothetical protein GW17_00057745 [Ensete ventricosum]|nr:hypothetical protein GW17_00057745 [Ensete ventricosum]
MLHHAGLPPWESPSGAFYGVVAKQVRKGEVGGGVIPRWWKAGTDEGNPKEGNFAESGNKGIRPQRHMGNPLAALHHIILTDQAILYYGLYSTARSSPRRHGISSKHSRAVFFFNGSLRFLRTFLGRKEDRRAFTASDAARPTMSFDMFGDVEEHFRRLLKETSSLRMPLSE